MITPKEATEAAIKFYRDATGDYSNVRLEEIELVGEIWHITLSFSKPSLVYEEKDYKIFKVNSNTGIVESMIMKK